MKYRTLGRTGFNVSEISFGAWAIGGSWGDVSDDDSLKAMGYSTDINGTVGRVNALMRVRGGYEGVSDPRGSGGAAGY